MYVEVPKSVQNANFLNKYYTSALLKFFIIKSLPHQPDLIICGPFHTRDRGHGGYMDVLRDRSLFTGRGAGNFEGGPLIFGKLPMGGHFF